MLTTADFKGAHLNSPDDISPAFHESCIITAVAHAQSLHLYCISGCHGKSPPSRIHPAQTDREAPLIQISAGGNWGWERQLSYIALLCDVQALWSTCKTTLRFHALHSITPLQRRTTWRRTQRARALGRPQLSSFIVVFQCHSASSESILRPVSVLLNTRHTERQSWLLLDFTQHCEYVVDALSYHTLPWYFITSRDVMLKNKLLVEWCWSRRGFKAPKSHLSAGLSSAAAH